tara:strand:+ start:3347 stop:4150 length:804 start_codon:yes stop_codon:yes gene_type:complete
LQNNLNKFYEVKQCERIWAIGSVHGNIESLKKIHLNIFEKFNPKDTLIYLGNVIGVGEYSKEVLNEIINFRFSLLVKFNINPDQVLFLRGAQEEMFLKLREIQLSPNPKEILVWMFNHGVDKTLISYGFESSEIFDTCDLGTIALSKWTSRLNNYINSCKGHKEYFSHLIHAVFSSTKKILFVNRGVDVSRPLSAQTDCFWWGYHGLPEIKTPYNSFTRIVRGYDPKKTGPSKNKIVCSLYKGSGFGNSIVAGIFSASGGIIDIFED